MQVFSYRVLHVARILALAVPNVGSIAYVLDFNRDANIHTPYGVQTLL